MRADRYPIYCTGYKRASHMTRMPCPRCGDILPIGEFGGISDRDGETELCIDCKTIEAAEDLDLTGRPQRRMRVAEGDEE